MYAYILWFYLPWLQISSVKKISVEFFHRLKDLLLWHFKINLNFFTPRRTFKLVVCLPIYLLNFLFFVLEKFLSFCKTFSFCQNFILNFKKRVSTKRPFILFWPTHFRSNFFYIYSLRKSVCEYLTHIFDYFSFCRNLPLSNINFWFQWKELFWKSILHKWLRPIFFAHKFLNIGIVIFESFVDLSTFFSKTNLSNLIL